MGEMTVPMDLEYKVTVRILPSGDEFEMELPADSTGKIIKQELLSHPELDIPRFDNEGNKHSFKLVAKQAGREIGDDQTIYECGVNNGETLLLKPGIVAG